MKASLASLFLLLPFPLVLLVLPLPSLCLPLLSFSGLPSFSSVLFFCDVIF